MEVQDKRYMEKLEGVQVLQESQGKPTKYKLIEPTLVEDLVQYVPEKYTAPTEKELDLLTEEDFIKIAFINKEEIWIYVERVDDENDLIYGKIAEKVRTANQLQQGQRVAVRRKHVCEVRYHEVLDDSDDEY